MLPIGVDVECIVDEVGARCSQTEDPEGSGGVGGDVAMEEDTRRAGSGEDQEVLDPVPGSGDAEEPSP